MSETTNPNLSGVAETLLITLYIRAIESQRPDALVKDERAEALVRQLDQESLQKTTTLTADYTRVAMILKSREFDRFAQDFFNAPPGCSCRSHRVRTRFALRARGQWPGGVVRPRFAGRYRTTPEINWR
jgi:hypothetical protein